MATIANLLVKIGVDNKKLIKGLNRAESAARRLASFIRKSLKRAFKVSIGAATVGVVGLIATLKEAANRTDTLAKTGKKLGIGTAELQKMQLQAKLSGVSVETMNMALQRMVRRISEAAMGTGEAKDALKELGLDAEYLNMLSPDKQFAQIAGAMKLVFNQADKVRLAMRLFDSEGVSLVNTLNSNLGETSDKFDRLGLGITKNQASAIESLNDSLTTVRGIFESISSKVLAGIAPAIQKVVENIELWIIKMGGTDRIAGMIVDKIKEWTPLVINFGKNAAMIMVDIFNDIKGIIDFISSAANKILSLFTKIGEIIKPIAEFTVGNKFNPLTYLDPKKAGNLAIGAGNIAESYLSPMSWFNPIKNSLPGMAQIPNNTQKVQVEIISDKNGLVDAVVRDNKLDSKVENKIRDTMKDAARGTRR